jgi:NitT/TauT family transport system substrate-binding protein
MLEFSIFMRMRARGGQNDSKTIDKVVINYARSFSDLSAGIIMHENLLEKYLPDGVEVEWTSLAAASDLRDGVLSGNVHIASYALPAYIMSMESDLPLVMIARDGASPIKVYANEERIQSILDFTDTDKISVLGLGSIMHIAFLAQAYELGMESSMFDSSFQIMPHADGLAALSGGNGVQGLILSFPTLIKADNTDSIHEVCDLTDIVLEYGIGPVEIVSEDFYENHPEIVEAYIKAREEALQLCYDEPERIAAVLAEEWEIDEDIVLETLMAMPPTLEITGYDKQAQLLYEMGLLENEPKKFEELSNYEALLKLQGK